MKKIIPRIVLNLIFLLLGGAAVRAQGGAITSVTFGPMGTPKAGVVVTICAQGATLVGSPPVCVVPEVDANCCFVDPGLTTHVTLPPGGGTLLTDGHGNYLVYAAPGVYNVSYTGTGVAQTNQQIPVACVPSNTSACGILNSVTNNFSAIQNFNAGLTTTTLAASGATTFVNINGARYVPLTGTVEATLLTCPATACTVIVPDNFTETFTSTITLGSTTQTINLFLGLNVNLICNVTSGANCIIPEGNSTITGSNFGGNGGGVAGGAIPGSSTIKLASTANVKSLISSSFPVTGNIQEYFQLSNLTLSGSGLLPTSCPETVTDSLLHLEQIFVPSSINNVTLANFCAIGLHIVGSTGGGGGIGNVTFNQVWSSGQQLPGARPIVIESTGGSVSSLAFYGGAAEDVPTGGINVEINGHGHAQAITGLLFSNHHIENENLGSGAPTGTIGYKITDANEVKFDNVDALFASDTNTAVISINQSGSALTENIMAENVRVGSPTSAVPLVLNNITSESITGGRTSFYSYSNSDTSKSAYWSGLASQTFATQIIVGTPALPVITLPNSGNGIFRNNLDSNLVVNLDAGLTAGQQKRLSFNDRGTGKWLLVADASNNFGLFDLVTSNYRFQFASGATFAALGAIRFTNTEHLSWRNAANSADDMIGEVQTQSVAGCTTTGGASAFTGPCTVTVTWPSQFADANYRVTCSGNGFAAGVPIFQGYTNQLAASVTTQTQQATGVNAAFTNIVCIGIHQ